jgi:hypothetical protein
VSAVPEPPSTYMLITSLAGVFATILRRRSARAKPL